MVRSSKAASQHPRCSTYSYTMGNAIAAFEEDIKGSIKVGKLADTAILSQDITTVPDGELMDTKVMMTILGGKVVYEKE